MNDPRPGTPHGHANLLSGHFYRVVRRGPGAQPVIREPANLDELRNAVRTLLEGLEPGAFRLQSNAVSITGTHDGEEVTVTVQYFVAQPPTSGRPPQADLPPTQAPGATPSPRKPTGSAGTCAPSTK